MCVRWNVQIYRVWMNVFFLFRFHFVFIVCLYVFFYYFGCRIWLFDHWWWRRRRRWWWWWLYTGQQQNDEKKKDFRQPILPLVYTIVEKLAQNYLHQITTTINDHIGHHHHHHYPQKLRYYPWDNENNWTTTKNINPLNWNISVNGYM